MGRGGEGTVKVRAGATAVISTSTERSKQTSVASCPISSAVSQVHCLVRVLDLFYLQQCYCTATNS